MGIGVSDPAKILFVKSAASEKMSAPEELCSLFDVEVAANWSEARRLMKQQCFDGVFSDTDNDAPKKQFFTDSFWVIQKLHQGVAILDQDKKILWANEQINEWADCENVIGLPFYSWLEGGQWETGDSCPCQTAVAKKSRTSALYKVSSEVYFRIEAKPVRRGNEESGELLVIIHDVTEEQFYRQKLDAIHEAGVELSNLSPEEVFHMEVKDRIELLKSNILHYTQEILSYEKVEIRLVNHRTGKLDPLLSTGIDKEAAERALEVGREANGITGFVAATGESYLVDDVTTDELFIESFSGAKSSLTVAIKWQEQVIGTFNVESPEEQAFSENDLNFLELFARNIAFALNTLDLLAAEKSSATQKSIEAIHREVALPIDKILNDAVNVMERYIGHEPEVVERLKRILRNARDIRQVIHKIGQDMAPGEAMPAGATVDHHPKLAGQRVLVVDANEGVRNDAHALLERYGCIVETAESGGEAVYMVRSSVGSESYSVIISDIHLPDFSGHQLMLRLKEIMDQVPLALMTGFGYDPGHSIVKARQAGLHPNAILYKPFRLDQLIEVCETLVDFHNDVART